MNEIGRKRTPIIRCLMRGAFLVPLCFLPSSLFSADAPNSVFRPAFEIGITHNGADRRGFRKTPHYERTYTLDIPLSKLGDAVFIQQGTNASQHQHLLGRSSRNDRVRLYIPEDIPNFNLFARAIANTFGEPLRPTAVSAFLPTTHGTYAIFDPEFADKAPFYIKPFGFVKKHPTAEAEWFGNPTNANSIAINQALHQLLGANSDHLFVQEPAIVNLKLNGEGTQKLAYSFLVRHYAPTGLNSEFIKDYSLLSGFLGLDRQGDYSYLLQQAARAKGISERKWVLDVFMPFYAKWLADLHHRKGLYPTHAANLHILVHPHTGAILNMSFKDLVDVSVDPLLFSHRNRPDLLLAAEKAGMIILGSEASRRTLENETIKTTSAKRESTIIAAHVDAHFLGFTSQILFFNKAFVEIDYAHVFIESYLKQTEKIVGFKIPLPGVERRSISEHYYQILFEQLNSTKIYDQVTPRIRLAWPAIQGLAILLQFGLPQLRYFLNDLRISEKLGPWRWNHMSKSLRSYLRWLGPELLLKSTNIVSRIASPCLSCLSYTLAKALKADRLNNDHDRFGSFMRVDKMNAQQLPPGVMASVYQAIQKERQQTRSSTSLRNACRRTYQKLKMW